MRFSCLLGFHGPKVRWDPKMGVWRCVSCGAMVWVGFPPGLDEGTLRVRWMTQEEAELRADEQDCSDLMIYGFQDRDVGDLVIRYELPPRTKLDTIVHEFIHWVAFKLPRPIRRRIDYLMDGVWYE